MYQIKGFKKNPFEEVGFGGKTKIEEINVKKSIPLLFSLIVPQTRETALGMLGKTDYSLAGKIDIVSSSQKKLDEKLERALNKMLYKDGTLTKEGLMKGYG